MSGFPVAFFILLLVEFFGVLELFLEAFFEIFGRPALVC